MNQDELFYHQAVAKLKTKTQKDPKPESLSRIYHNIANLKKKQDMNVLEKNELKIKERKTNEYEELSPKEVEEVVGYEAVSEKILELGTKVNYKFSSIEKDSNGIINLLAEISSRFQKEIQGLKFNLNLE